ncbi:MAG TPA: BrnT family toxin [Blastocatellia bacterium]|nr:BrnT family toxin [Blastocatellia bacterium]
MDFEWDIAKAVKNLKRHKVSFKEAATVFGNPLSITYPDPDHSIDEHRFITIGESGRGRLLMVAHTERGDNIRLISAREVTRQERQFYEEES